jgi:hypothetical protein
MLSFKAIIPTFYALRNNTLTLDGNKTGKMLLEWIPRGPDGTVHFSWILVPLFSFL